MIPESRLQPRRIRLRVLIVEDLIGEASWLGIMLRAAGCDVRTAQRGAEAIAIAVEFHPDAVLIDINLPDMDGFSVARQLRENPLHRDTLFLAITGRSDEESRRRAKECGIEHYCVKPVFSEEIVELLAQFEARRRPDPPLSQSSAKAS